MRMLVLGGTAWLGREIAMVASSRGHEVTCLARGRAGAAAEGVAFVRADRDSPDAYDAVTGTEWDTVFDVARQPGQVRGAVAALAAQARSFVYVSSGSVYADDATPGQDESAPVLPALERDVMDGPEDYGRAKVACEQHVLAGFGLDRALIARAGLIGGPGDHTGRSGYWPLRFARPATSDGSVLIPRSPDLLVEVIDVRDLADWLVSCGESAVCGVFNAVGEPVRFPDHLQRARQVAGHTGRVVEADPAWLSAKGVEPWMGERSLPLWLPLPEYAGHGSRDGGAAVRAGLRLRPLAQTLADVLAWELARPATAPRAAGLSDDDERALLAELVS